MSAPRATGGKAGTSSPRQAQPGPDGRAAPSPHGQAAVPVPGRAMVLAAGEGRRMRPLTATRPKPLIPVAGRAMLDHVLDRLAAARVGQVVVNACYLGDQIVSHLADRRQPAITISRETDLLDTGGGIRQALPLLGDAPFYTLNADCFWLDGAVPALLRLARHWDPARMDALLLLTRTVGALGYDGPGDFVAEPDGRLARRLPGTLSPHLYAGIQILSPAALAGMPDGAFSLNAVWDRIEAAGRLYGVIHDGLWFHVGTPDDLALTEEWLARNRLTP